ncbi:MAG TPA: FG-GAP-like repeat-containing protein [Dokdonella sp.]|nr:FG-GAP-like repeat-containing protein [Dokdonella sp.]
MRDRSGFRRGPGGARACMRRLALTLLCIAALPSGVRGDDAPITTKNPSPLARDAEGRAYRVERVAKAGAKYEWIDAHTVRYYPFARYEVVREDAEYLYVKQYVAGVQKNVAPPLPPALHVDLASSRKFGLRDFGTGLPHAGQWRDGFALADIDGDGHLDIAFASARKSLTKPVVLRGDGQGSWTRWPMRLPELPYDYGAAAVADFDADGRADLAFGMHLRGLTVLVADGNAGFTRHDRGLPLGAPGSSTPALFSTHAIAVLDWNGDGRPDLLALSERLLGHRDRFGNVAVFVGRRGGWTRATLPNGKLPVGNAALAVLAGTRSDLAIVVGDDANGGIATYEFAAGRVVERALDAVPAGAIVRAAAAADASTVAVAYQVRTAKGWQTAVDVFRRSGDGYERRPLSAEQDLAIGALAFGHLSSPRSLDLAALRSDGALLLFAADGNGSWTRDLVEAAPSWRSGCAGHALRLRDLDGDGRDEIVAAFSGEPNAMMMRRDCIRGGGIEAWRVVDSNDQG